MKKLGKKAFTLIELLVVIAVIGILVLFGAPRFTGHTQKAELTRIQHDIKVMEQEVGTVLSTDDDDFNKWDNNNKDLSQLIQEGKLFEKEGVAKEVESIDGPYKVIPEKHKDKINTKLKGTFYANSNGKVYYEHGKSLSGIPADPEKPTEPGEKEPVLEGPIPIATAEELDSIRKTEKLTYGAGTQWEGLYEGGLDKQYIQVADIDLSEYDGWSPIGSDYSSSFTGTYDGGNYVIRGLEVKGKGKDAQGLFGRIVGATIRNVDLIDNKVTSEYNAGGLVGEAYDSTIENSYATGSVKGTGKGLEAQVGGLVGLAQNSTIRTSYSTGSVTGGDYAGGLVGSVWRSTIDNSYFTGSVTGRENVGGLVGKTWYSTTISNSYATGSVEGTEEVGGLVGHAYGENDKISNSYATGSVEGIEEVGGLVGYHNHGTIENSYATGSVKGSREVGGLVGNTGWSTIKNSYATGPVTGGRYVGGLVGWANGGTIENSYATGSATGTGQVGGLVGQANGGTISNSYAKGSVTGTDKVGGLVGYVYNNTDSYWDTEINNSYWDKETTGQSSSDGAGATGKSTDEMNQEDTYEGWNFETIWKIDEGKDYPKLR